MVLLIMLAATGVWITWIDAPVPESVAAWNDVESLTDQPSGSWVLPLHQWLIIPAAVAALTWLLTAWSPPRPALRWPIPAAVVLLLLASGLAVAFAPAGHDDVWWMTIGSNVTGFEPVGGNQPVDIVLTDGSIVSLNEIRRWLLAHLTVGALAAVVAIAGLILNDRMTSSTDQV